MFTLPDLHYFSTETNAPVVEDDDEDDEDPDDDLDI